MGEKREYILIAAELHDSFEDTQLPYETAEEMFGNQ
jgi:(p)ppGpp synthase/HD superfamily hydrolase